MPSITTVGLTPEQMARRLAAYRSRHTIAPVPPWDGRDPVCDTDGIRLFRRHSKARQMTLWMHDPTEIRALVAGAPADLVRVLMRE